jgi:hypothetical protein
MNEAKLLLASWGRSFLAASYLLPNRGYARRLYVKCRNGRRYPVILRWLNPNDVAFGRTKSEV